MEVQLVRKITALLALLCGWVALPDTRPIYWLVSYTWFTILFGVKAQNWQQKPKCTFWSHNHTIIWMKCWNVQYWFHLAFAINLKYMLVFRSNTCKYQIEQILHMSTMCSTHSLHLNATRGQTHLNWQLWCCTSKGNNPHYDNNKFGSLCCTNCFHFHWMTNSKVSKQRK